MRMAAPLRLALLSLFALTLAACSTAEDYLTNINPFRRQDQAAPPPPAAPPQPAPAPVQSTPLPAPRPSEPAR
jgi:uncharacterized lipoprotein